MATEANVLRITSNWFLGALIYSLSGAIRRRGPMDPREREEFTEVRLIVEEVRIRLGTYAPYGRDFSPIDWQEVLVFLNRFVETFLSSESAQRLFFDRRFRFFSTSAREEELYPDFSKRFDKDCTIEEAVHLFKSFLNDEGREVSAAQATLNFGGLSSIVPKKQQVAPVQFKVVDGVVRVLKKDPVILQGDKENIGHALNHVGDSGSKLIESLERSNCDKRLIESVKELQTEILNKSNVIGIGLKNISCGLMCAQFQNELPDAVFAMFNSYNTSVSMYLSQFPEWRQFSEQAASIELTAEDVADVDRTASELIDELIRNSTLADPEVPKIISFVRSFMKSPGLTSKKAVFAMIRTMENFVASILGGFVEFSEQTLKKTADQMSTAASKIIVGLLGLALLSASGIGAAAMHAGVPWVKQAAEVVRAQIEKNETLVSK